VYDRELVLSPSRRTLASSWRLGVNSCIFAEEICTIGDIGVEILYLLEEIRTLAIIGIELPPLIFPMSVSACYVPGLA